MAKSSKPPKFKRNRNPLTWLLRHAQMSLSSLGRLTRNPIGTLMTAAVLGIAIALPSGLHLLIGNINELSGSWEGSSSISLFLNHQVSAEQARKVHQVISQRHEVAEARLIDREQAMDEFRRQSGFGNALDLLDNNPLPAVVLVKPAMKFSSAEATERLARTLQDFKEIDLAQADLQWVRRLDAITQTVQRGILVLGILLSAAVLLIIGNTIRLEIQNRHQEIEITKLVGGTNAFIRRPFLYEGIWYGLLGAVIALLLILVSLWLLQGPVERLAGLYQSSFDLSILTSGTFLAVLIGSPLLGLGGAWLAVGKHLNAIQPE